MSTDQDSTKPSAGASPLSGEELPAFPFSVNTAVGTPAPVVNPIVASASGETAPESLVAPSVARAIEFRVTRPGGPVRRLRLSGQRYTFGNGEGCSIRLDEPSLRPLHAVLIRDGDRILVRAYSIPIEVNGNRTSETTLDVGDVLKFGDYRLELVSVATQSDVPHNDLLERTSNAQRSTRERKPLTDEPRPVDAVNKTAAGDTTSSMDKGAAEERDLDDTFPMRSFTSAQAGQPSGADAETQAIDQQVWRDRLRREVELWRKRQAECERRVERCSHREAELQKRESELWNRAERLQHRESRLKSQEAAAFEIQKEYAVQQEEVAELEREKAQLEQRLEENESRFRKREQDYLDEAEQASTQLQQSRQQAETATASVQRMHEQLAALNQQLQDLSDNQRDLENQEATRFAEREAECRDLESARDEAARERDEAVARRDEAIDADNASRRELEQTQERQRDAEARLQEMQQQLDAAKQDAESQQQSADSLATELRGQVEELQRLLETAQQDSAKLNEQFEEARQRIAELEAGDSDERTQWQRQREQWESQTEELRASVDQLSGELEAAKDQLQQLTTANEELAERLEDMNRQREQAVREAEDRPTQASFESVREELSQANAKLQELREENERIAGGEAKSDESAGDPGKGDGPEGDGQPEAWPQEVGLHDAEVQEPKEAEAGEVGIDPEETGDVEASETGSPWQSEWTHDGENSPEQTSETGEDETGNAAESVSSWQAMLEQRDSDEIQSDEPQTADPAAESTDDHTAWSASQTDDAHTAAWQSPESFDDAEESAGEPDSEIAEPSPWSQTDSEPSSFIEPEHGESDQFIAPEISETEEPIVAANPWATAQEDESASGSLASQLLSDIARESESDAISDAATDEDDDDYTPTMNLDELRGDSPADWAGGEGDPSHGEPEDTGSTMETDGPAFDLSHPAIDDDEPTSSDSVMTEAEYVESTDSVVTENADEVPAETPVVAEPAANPVAEDDDSIEAYMNRLLQRVQGGPGQPAPPAPSAKPAKVEPPEDSDSDEVNEVTAEPVVEAIDHDAPLVARSQAPEKNTNLSAMRQLANDSARSAINRSMKLQSRDTQLRAMSKFVVGGAFFGCGCISAWFIPLFWIKLVALLAGSIAGSIFVREGVTLLRDSRRRSLIAATRVESEQETTSED